MLLVAEGVEAVEAVEDSALETELVVEAGVVGRAEDGAGDEADREIVEAEAEAEAEAEVGVAEAEVDAGDASIKPIKQK